MENTVGVEVEVLDAVVPQKAFEEVCAPQSARTSGSRLRSSPWGTGPRRRPSNCPSPSHG
jgi:hypothetical protein